MGSDKWIGEYGSRFIKTDPMLAFVSLFLRWIPGNCSPFCVGSYQPNPVDRRNFIAANRLESHGDFLLAGQ